MSREDMKAQEREVHPGSCDDSFQHGAVPTGCGCEPSCASDSEDGQPQVSAGHEGCEDPAIHRCPLRPAVPGPNAAGQRDANNGFLDYLESNVDNLTKMERTWYKFESKRVSGDLKSQKARGFTEKLITRTTTGFVYTIVVLTCLLVGSVATAVMVAGMSWLCCSEFFRLVRKCGMAPSETIGLTAAVLLPLSVLLPTLATAISLFIFAIALGLWYLSNPQESIANVAITLFGPLYTSLLLSSIVSIRLMEPGLWGGVMTFLVMSSVWLNDAFAYFVGSRFGRHKMAPRISPNKTWEGFFGGMFGSCLVWVFIAATGIVHISMVGAVLGGIVVGCSSVVGDLCESRVKRAAGVKDSGNLLPGHGGLLDRSDSLLFGVMAADLMLRLGGIL